MKRVLRHKNYSKPRNERNLEHLPYEEGIKTQLPFIGLTNTALEHLPYEEGIKTAPAMLGKAIMALEHLPYEEGIKTYHSRWTCLIGILEHLPYEEGIKTPSITSIFLSAGSLEHLPYEEGIKTRREGLFFGPCPSWNTYPMKRVLRLWRGGWILNWILLGTPTL